MIDAFKTHSSDIFGQPFTDSDVTRALLAKTKDKDAVMSAIAGKDPACLRLVLEKVDTVANPLDNRKKLDYLLLAIKKNQPISVQILVENLSPALLQTVSLSLSVIEKTDLGLLNTLQSHGMVFQIKPKRLLHRKNISQWVYCFPWGLHSSNSLIFVERFYLKMKAFLVTKINSNFLPSSRK
ncbi:hypothetical protein [Legionella feeleii]|uniref:Ankyrin repeat-containing protein n=1 Tax=Legionella feeleii TaxID=453 RepID=A0A2X1QZA3_9GAMM|nr:hypothetical protein [Legionella feeleii]SPX59660.1 ankyrin repeat-containing protein [Legionella feeleii]